MARPRIFISSTYYDLKQVRSNLERFIKEIGYEPILHERGLIPYGNNEKLEEYCYKEIFNTDVLISIIGGRYGSTSKDDYHSVSQLELKTAFEQYKQVYIFIDKSVYNEFRFYQKNKENTEVKYTFADDVKIYEFIEYVESLPHNNTIHGFETSSDITTFLKEQWAGLFQRFLQQNVRQQEINVIRGIENTAKTLNQLVTFLTEEKRDKDNAINEILLSNHPAMEQVRELLSIKYRVYFTNKAELSELLSARGFSEQDVLPFEDEVWAMKRRGQIRELKISEKIFNGDGKLKVYTKEEWNNNYISMTTTDLVDDGTDLPF